MKRLGKLLGAKAWAALAVAVACAAWIVSSPRPEPEPLAPRRKPDRPPKTEAMKPLKPERWREWPPEASRCVEPGDCLLVSYDCFSYAAVNRASKPLVDRGSWGTEGLPLDAYACPEVYMPAPLPPACVSGRCGYETASGEFTALYVERGPR